jgi:hypothetical protein
MSDDERRDRFERALADGGCTHSVADVLQLIKAGRAQLWERGDGTIVTEVHTFPRLKSVHYWLASGELHDCLGLQDEIDEWARGEGCEIATIVGRRGWGRAAKGWTLDGYHYRKPLGHFWSDRP